MSWQKDAKVGWNYLAIEVVALGPKFSESLPVAVTATQRNLVKRDNLKP